MFSPLSLPCHPRLNLALFRRKQYPQRYCVGSIILAREMRLLPLSRPSWTLPRIRHTSRSLVCGVMEFAPGSCCRTSLHTYLHGRNGENRGIPDARGARNRLLSKLGQCRFGDGKLNDKSMIRAGFPKSTFCHISVLFSRRQDEALQVREATNGISCHDVPEVTLVLRHARSMARHYSFDTLKLFFCPRFSISSREGCH